MQIVDIASSPTYNPETNQGRGDWSLHDVSKGDVTIDPVWNKPRCIDHNAMNCVSSDKTLWRCLTCARGCYDLDSYKPEE